MNCDPDLAEVDYGPRPCVMCGKPLPESWDYAACEECGKQCPHGNAPHECETCMVESDIAYDQAREERHFGGSKGRD